MTTILIVEDEQFVRQLLITILRREHRVLEATNAIQAIALARLHQPDLVLLDLNLQSRHDGLEVCRALRSDPNSALAQIPIVMLTGQIGTQIAEAALAAGANNYIDKPYSPHALLLLVEALLAGNDRD